MELLKTVQLYAVIKMGVHKKIESPEKLLEYFKQYREFTKSNPFVIEDWVGGMAKDVERKKEKPLTVEGFENWLEDQNIIGQLSHYFANTNNAYSEFLTICSRIKREIRQDQIEGGMAGIYNPSITQRLNSLVDKSENVVVVEQPLFPD